MDTSRSPNLTTETTRLPSGATFIPWTWASSKLPWIPPPDLIRVHQRREPSWALFVIWVAVPQPFSIRRPDWYVLPCGSYSTSAVSWSARERS